MSKIADYESKAITTQIRATSRVAVKIKDNFYTLEFTEERTVPEVEGVDLERERTLLWDSVNASVDEQVEELMQAFAKK